MHSVSTALFLRKSQLKTAKRVKQIYFDNLYFTQNYTKNLKEAFSNNRLKTAQRKEQNNSKLQEKGKRDCFCLKAKRFFFAFLYFNVIIKGKKTENIPKSRKKCI